MVDLGGENQVFLFCGSWYMMLGAFFRFSSILYIDGWRLCSKGITSEFAAPIVSTWEGL